MSTPNGIERRIHLRAYAYGKICSVSIMGINHQVDLIDISPGGSRLRFSAGPVSGLKENDILEMSCLDPSLASLICGVSAEVRWLSQSEIGVRFLKELPMTTSDIQRLIAPSEA
ncbi:MAG: PilZ domain-containing protein [Desulfovibrio sp.]|nr:PilZ domain-containing protein [Desulfovibrio sp.]